MADKEIGMQRVYTATFTQDDIDRLLIEAAKDRMQKTYGESYRTPEGSRHGIVRPLGESGCEVIVAVEEAARVADIVPMASNAKR